MASSSTLSYLPKEVRFKVYEAVAARPGGAKTVLQRWFETRDIEQQIAQLQNVDSNTIYQAAYDREDSSSDEDDEQHLQEEVNEEDDDAMQIDEDDEDEDDDDDDDDENEYVSGEEDQDDEIDGEEDDDLDDIEENGDENEEEHEVENEEVNEDEDDEAMESEDHDEVMISNDTHTTVAGVATTGDETDATSTHQTQVVRHVRAHRKWRHIPKFLRISHSPPPKELMLLSKDLAEEVREWFYDVAVVHINATGSFAHITMLEEALPKIEEGECSPFERIRKVEVSFVYDSQWTRGPDCLGQEMAFEQILLVRAGTVANFLANFFTFRVPQLQKVHINWHDTVFDSQSASLKYQVLDIFDNLSVDIEVKEHYLTPGKKPHRKSLLGRKRLEFQDIADQGFRFF